MIPLSTSRLYIFGVKYSNNDVNLVLNIHKLLKRYEGFSYRSIEVIKSIEDRDRDFDLDLLKCEIHINHICVDKQRFFSSDMSNEIRIKIATILTLLSDFSYDQMHFVNDGFDRQSSLGLARIIS